MYLAYLFIHISYKDKRTEVWCIYTQIFSQKKPPFFHFFKVKKKLLCNFLARTLQCFQKKSKFFFRSKKVKKQALKVAHNRPRPFYFTVQPRPQTIAHSTELIFHIMKSRDQISVLLSVARGTCSMFGTYCIENVSYVHNLEDESNKLLTMVHQTNL